MGGGELCEPLVLRVVIVGVEGIELPGQFAVFPGARVCFVDPLLELIPQLVELLLSCPGFLFTGHDSALPQMVRALRSWGGSGFAHDGVTMVAGHQVPMISPVVSVKVTWIRCSVCAVIITGIGRVPVRVGNCAIPGRCVSGWAGSSPG